MVNVDRRMRRARRFMTSSPARTRRRSRTRRRARLHRHAARDGAPGASSSTHRPCASAPPAPHCFGTRFRMRSPSASRTRSAVSPSAPAPPSPRRLPAPVARGAALVLRNGSLQQAARSAHQSPPRSSWSPDPASRCRAGTARCHSAGGRRCSASRGSRAAASRTRRSAHDLHQVAELDRVRVDPPPIAAVACAQASSSAAAWARRASLRRCRRPPTSGRGRSRMAPPLRHPARRSAPRRARRVRPVPPDDVVVADSAAMAQFTRHVQRRAVAVDHRLQQRVGC
jgi:hypothetical protein